MITLLVKIKEYIIKADKAFVDLQLQTIIKFRGHIAGKMGHEVEEVEETELLASYEIANGLETHYEATNNDGVKLYSIVNKNSNRAKNYLLGNNNKRYEITETDTNIKH